MASQTKYTALLMPAVLFVYALLFRRLRLWALTAGIAAALFAGWETFMHLRYGRSHFLLHLEANHTDLWGKLEFVPPLFSLIGSMGPGLLLLGLAAFKRSRRTLAATAVLLAAGFFVVAATPESQISFSSLRLVNESLTLPYLIFASFGLATIVTLGHASLRLLRVLPGRPFVRARRTDGFLVAWLGLELLGYFAMSPFPAARRVLGLVVVGTIVAGRLASRTLRSRDGRRRVLAAAACSASFGALFFGVDLKEALATRQAVEDSAQWIWLRSAPGSRIFYVGHWGFQYYAEAAGMIAAVDRQFYRRTILRAGDWLIVPSTRIFQQRFWIDPERTEKAHVLLLSDALPLRSFFCYYMGWTPLERHDGPRLVVTIYRVKEDFPVRPYRGSRAPS